MKKIVLSAATVLLTFCVNAETANNLGDPETLDKIIAEAIDLEKLQKRGEEGEEIRYAPDQNTPYTGWEKLMHENGQIELLIQYKDGKMDGLGARWHANGQKVVEGNLKDGKVWTVVGWKPNGEKSETNVVKGNGVLVYEYYENGQKQSQLNFKDGKMDGLGTRWYRNGQMEKEVTYRDGKKDGLLTEWYGNGQKRLELNYKDGKEDGLTTLWYENGKKQGEGTYKGDKLMTAVIWKPNGEKCPETNIVDGNGLAVFYNDDGTENRRQTCKDGDWVED